MKYEWFMNSQIFEIYCTCLLINRACISGPNQGSVILKFLERAGYHNGIQGVWRYANQFCKVA